MGAKKKLIARMALWTGIVLALAAVVAVVSLLIDMQDRQRGPVYVWAMDTAGDFVFGVPQSAFKKLNAIYDREVTPRLKEGVFLDRHTFLLSLIDDHGDLGTETVAGDAVDLVQRGGRWRVDRWESDTAVVLSTPLKTGAGGALGSLYLKQVPSRRHEDHRDDDRVQAALA